MVNKTASEGKCGKIGYPAVERLIETEDFKDINEAFESAYEELIIIKKRKKGLKTQRDSKRIMRALELTMELLRELLAIKYRIIEEKKAKQPDL